MNFSEFKQLNIEEQQEYNIFIENLFGDRIQVMSVWQELYSGLKSMSDSDMFQYRNTYLYWFTILSWDIYRELSREEILYVLQHTLFTACTTGEDVWKAFIEYLHVRSIDETDMMQFFTTCKQALLSSSEIVVKKENNYYTVANVIQDIEKNESKGDSLIDADFFTQFQSYMQRRANEIIEDVNIFDAVNNFRSFINFILGVKPENIFVTIDAIYYPQKYEQLEKLQQAGTAIPKVVAPTSTDASVESVSDQNLQPTTSPELQKPSYPLIRQEIEAEFHYDDTDTLSPLEDVLHRLEELATEHNDPQIQDLYYFDESHGGFVWNDELLQR